MGDKVRHRHTIASPCPRIGHLFSLGMSPFNKKPGMFRKMKFFPPLHLPEHTRLVLCSRTNAACAILPDTTHHQDTQGSLRGCAVMYEICGLRAILDTELTQNTLHMLLHSLLSNMQSL